MNPEARAHWRQAAALLREWQEHAPEERAAWRSAQQPAPEVAAILDRLIAAQDSVDPRLDALESGVLPPPDNALAGLRCGAWELIEEIGRGGMAVVYRARRMDAGFEQQAAVKLLGRVLRGPAERQRFAREQQILARLQHPHIAGLIDGGVGADGTPYLVMALIEGERIDAYCDAKSLGLRQRAALLLQVCEAVAQAHRQLVVHRDLKPGNILVDGHGHAVLLDFGIARLLDDASGEHTATYAFTPGYAAPEQRRGDGAVGTAVDVYGIGAVAHRVLAGVAPRHDGNGDPLLPSQLAAEAGNVFLQRRLQGDLDAMLVQALADDPRRRYGSVEAFAADLRAWLGQRPVAARAPRLGYRAGRFVRRHAGLVAASVLLAVAVAGGIVATLWQAREATRHAARAESVLQFLDDAMDELVPDTPSAAAQADRRAMLDRLAERGAAQFATQPLAHADVLRRLADLYMNVGAVDRAADVTDEAVQRLRSAVPAGDAELAALEADAAFLAFRRGGAQDRAAIETRFLAAIDALAAADAQQPLAQARIYYASFLGDGSRPDDAMQQLLQAQSTAEALGDSAMQDALDSQIGGHLRNFGTSAQALAFYQRTLDKVRARHGEEHEMTARALLGLGHALSMDGQRDEAADTMLRGIALLDRIYPEGNFTVVNALTLVVPVLERAGRLDEAARFGERYLAQARAMFGARHLQAGSALVTLARVRLSQGETDAAVAMLREAVAVYLDAVGADSDFVGIARQQLAGALHQQGQYDAALAERELALEIMARVYGSNSRQYASALLGRAGDHEQLGHHAAALRDYREALAALIELQDRGGLIEAARVGLAGALLRGGDIDAARTLVDEAIAALRTQSGSARRTLLAGLLVRAEIACQSEDIAACASWAQDTRSHAGTLDTPVAVLETRIAALPE